MSRREKFSFITPVETEPVIVEKKPTAFKSPSVRVLEEFQQSGLKYALVTRERLPEKKKGEKIEAKTLVRGLKMAIGRKKIKGIIVGLTPEGNVALIKT